MTSSDTWAAKRNRTSILERLNDGRGQFESLTFGDLFGGAGAGDEDVD
jgi:hypothetical protein